MRQPNRAPKDTQHLSGQTYRSIGRLNSVYPHLSQRSEKRSTALLVEETWTYAGPSLYERACALWDQYVEVTGREGEHCPRS